MTNPTQPSGWGGSASPTPPGHSASSGQRREDERETSRVEAFSDGVFAIAITLLILEIKVPHDHGADLSRQLLALWPSYVAFLMSFVTTGIMWINHHRLFTYISRVDHTLLKYNMLLLLGVTFVPFPTAVLAAHLGDAGARAAAAFCGGTFVFIAIAFNLLWRHATSPRRKRHMLRVPLDHPGVVEIHRAYALGPPIYLLVTLLAFWNAAASVALNLALAIFFALPPRHHPTD